MGRYYQYLLLVVAALLVTSEAITMTAKSSKAQIVRATSSDTLSGDRLLTAEQSDGFKKRSLRTVTTEDGNDENAADEERGIQAAILSKLSNWATKMNLKETGKNLQFRAWLKAEQTPAQVFAELKLTGKPRAVVKADKQNYDLWREYSSIWNALGGRYMTRT